MRDRPADLLVARVRTIVPEGRSFLLTSPRESKWVMTVATEFAAALQSSEDAIELVNLVSPRGGGVSDTPSHNDDILGAALRLRLAIGDTRGARAAISAAPGVIALASDGIVDRGMPLTLAGAVDGVILVVKQGESRSADIPLAVRAIEDAGGRLLVIAYRP